MLPARQSVIKRKKSQSPQLFISYNIWNKISTWREVCSLDISLSRYSFTLKIDIGNNFFILTPPSANNNKTYSVWGKSTKEIFSVTHVWWRFLVIIFSCEDTAQQVLMSVCLSVCLSSNLKFFHSAICTVPECSRLFQNVLECSGLFQNACSLQFHGRLQEDFR